MKLITRAALLTCALLLSGCSYFDSASNIHVRDRNFKEARSIAPLRIPQGVSSSAFHNKYPVANRHYSEKQLDVNIDPPGLQKS